MRRARAALYVFVRVPPSLADCHRMGYRIEDWLNPRIVDVVLPSAVDDPGARHAGAGTGRSLRAVRGAGDPSLYPRTSYMWPFLKRPKRRTTPGARPARSLLALWRGAMANYRTRGAAGVQLFNFNLPADAWTCTRSCAIA